MRKFTKDKEEPKEEIEFGISETPKKSPTDKEIKNKEKPEADKDPTKGKVEPKVEEPEPEKVEPEISKEEFEELKKLVEEIKKSFTETSSQLKKQLTELKELMDEGSEITNIKEIAEKFMLPSEVRNDSFMASKITSRFLGQRRSFFIK